VTIRRAKLAAQIAAQVEDGRKLTINFSCPSICRGQDQSVYLYRPGVEQLIRSWRKLWTALNDKRDTVVILETCIDVLTGTTDYVTVNVDAVKGKIVFVHTRLSVWPTVSIHGVGSAAPIRPYQSQSVELTLGEFDKLEMLMLRAVETELFDGVVDEENGSSSEEEAGMPGENTSPATSSTEEREAMRMSHHHVVVNGGVAVAQSEIITADVVATARSPTTESVAAAAAAMSAAASERKEDDSASSISSSQNDESVDGGGDYDDSSDSLSDRLVSSASEVNCLKSASAADALKPIEKRDSSDTRSSTA
jgi:hypothetical protein